MITSCLLKYHFYWLFYMTTTNSLFNVQAGYFLLNYPCLLSSLRRTRQVSFPCSGIPGPEWFALISVVQNADKKTTCWEVTNPVR